MAAYDVEYKITGISNVNKILPTGSNWYYKFLKDGSLQVGANALDGFSEKAFEQKVIENGGSIQSIQPFPSVSEARSFPNTGEEALTLSKENVQQVNNLSNEKKNVMEGIKEENHQGARRVSPAVEDASKEFKEYSSVNLISNYGIQDSASFTDKLIRHLSHGTCNAQAAIEAKLEEIKQGLSDGTTISASTYTPPTCEPIITSGISYLAFTAGETPTDSKIETGTIEAAPQNNCISLVFDKNNVGKLKVTFTTIVDDVPVNCKKTYLMNNVKYSSSDMLTALSKFSQGKAFLGKLINSVEIFAIPPSNE